MIDYKNDKRYVFLLCVYAVGKEKAKYACGIVDNHYYGAYALSDKKELLMQMIDEEVDTVDANYVIKEEAYIEQSSNKSRQTEKRLIKKTKKLVKIRS